MCLKTLTCRKQAVYMESCLLVSELSDNRVGSQEIQLHNNCLSTLSPGRLVFFAVHVWWFPQLAALHKALGLIMQTSVSWAWEKCQLRGCGDGSKVKVLMLQALALEGAQVNAGWVWWPTCNFSLGSQRWHIQSKLASETNYVSELWVWWREPALMNKVTEQSWMIPDIYLRPLYASAQTYTETCMYTRRTSRTHENGEQQSRA